MKFLPTPFKESKLLQEERRIDSRGYFARSFCEKELAKEGLETKIVQINHSMSLAKGTLRGLHYQTPNEETKIVSCVKGAIWDVIVDMRKDSPTFLKYFGTTLSEENGLSLFVPRGFAHGFVTLEPDSAILYYTSESYSPESEKGVRYNDPKIGIAWPIPPKTLSEKDQNHPFL